MDTSGISLRRLRTFLEELGNKFAEKKHSHATSEITGLDTALSGKANSSHVHDDRYYTENEIDTKLASKLNVSGGTLTGQLNINGIAGDKPLRVRGIVGSDGSGSDGELHFQFGANQPIKLGNEAVYSISADGGTYTGKASNAGNADKVNGHTVNSDVPANAKFTDTNTWRGIQDNLISTSTTDSLSANQGKVLKGLVDGKMNNSRYYFSDHNVYKCLGTATLRQTGDYLFIRICFGNGYNASSSQDRMIDIHIRTSNGTASNNKYYAGYTESHSLGTISELVYVVQNSSTSFTIWVGKLNYTGTSFYDVYLPTGASWSSSTTTSNTVPTNGVALQNKRISYIEEKTNAEYTALGSNYEANTLYFVKN